MKKSDEDSFGEVLPIAMSDIEKMQAAIVNMREGMALQIEFAAIRAQLNWELYKKHLDAGFTVEQSMEIVKAKGI